MSGDPSEYSLVVTRGADLDLTVPGHEQDISLTHAVLGGWQDGTAIQVAVVSSDSSAYDMGLQAMVDQLNDDTWFNFDASLVSRDSADTVEELVAKSHLF